MQNPTTHEGRSASERALEELERIAEDIRVRVHLAFANRIP